ncbi:MAG: hypothetical protein IPN34_22290 [Planctomycetes bacterium]|nr:hypothetical protein [Planctomycetota bacterium]
MPLDQAITSWLIHLERGEGEAAERIWRQYFEQCCRLARARFAAPLRREHDAEDVASSALRALCAGVEAGRFDRLESRNDLWRLLATITIRKASNAARHRLGRPEVGESALGGDATGALPFQELSDQRVLGEWSAICDEMIEKLEPKLKEVALLRLQGFTNPEIAERLERSVKTIERYLGLIRLEWSE